MYNLLVCGFFSIISFYAFNFFCVRKSYYEGDSGQTDATSVRTLYSKIKDMHQNKTSNSLCNKVRLHTTVSLETVKSLAKYKYHRFLLKNYTPKQIGDSLFVLPYYNKGNWYNALIKHKNTIRKIVKVTTIHTSDYLPDETEDVTAVILKYLGPEENFFGQSVTPNDLGYANLYFSMFSDTGDIFKFKFKGNEPIKFDL